MNTRRFILHLIVGLLTFLIGVTAAIALGSFNPLERFDRTNVRHQYTIPQQSLSNLDEMPLRYNGCPHARLRTAELHSHLEPLNPSAPLAPVAPFDGEDLPPPPPSAPRVNR